ncbi:MAG: hypothetical protein R6V85_01865, partial [Polyangia bacterium]
MLYTGRRVGCNGSIPRCEESVSGRGSGGWRSIAIPRLENPATRSKRPVRSDHRHLAEAGGDLVVAYLVFDIIAVS